jgi:hypothetical protein
MARGGNGFMLYYSYISDKAENSVLGDDAICI